MSAVVANRTGVIALSWNTPSVRVEELPITGYSILYHVNGNTIRNFTLMTQSSPVEITGLDPGTTYQVYIASVSVIGIGKYCCTRYKVVFRPYDG